MSKLEDAARALLDSWDPDAPGYWPEMVALHTALAEHEAELAAEKTALRVAEDRLITAEGRLEDEIALSRRLAGDLAAVTAERDALRVAAMRQSIDDAIAASKEKP